MVRRRTPMRMADVPTPPYIRFRPTAAYPRLSIFKPPLLDPTASKHSPLSPILALRILFFTLPPPPLRFSHLPRMLGRLPFFPFAAPIFFGGGNLFYWQPAFSFSHSPPFDICGRVPSTRDRSPPTVILLILSSAGRLSFFFFFVLYLPSFRCFFSLRLTLLNLSVTTSAELLAADRPCFAGHEVVPGLLDFGDRINAPGHWSQRIGIFLLPHRDCLAKKSFDPIQ